MLIMCTIRKLCSSDNCKVCYDRCLLSHPRHIDIFDKETNNPRQIFKFSNKKIEFKCDKCEHIFESNISNITDKNRWCPYCSTPPKKLCENDCPKCYKKSFASHEKSKFIVNKEKNNPRQIFMKSEQKIEFYCNVCEHIFISMVGNITAHNTWCTYCAGTTLCNKIDCKMCYENSFASHEKNIFWSDKNTKKPREVFKGTDMKYWFNCICGHEFDTNLLNIVLGGNWCPYCCVPSIKICQNDNCTQCYENSFASHEKSLFWSTKNTCKPREIFKGTHSKFWFVCDVCNNEFETVINGICGRGVWCSLCVNKTQLKLFNYLKSQYINVKNEFKDTWTINSNTKKHYRFDFLIKEYKILIELDGEQHFSQVSNWTDPEKTMENDIEKMNKALINNYSVIRILQDDIFYDKNEWKNKLKNAIKKYEKSTLIYIDNNKNKYDNHKKMMGKTI